MRFHRTLITAAVLLISGGCAEKNKAQLPQSVSSEEVSEISEQDAEFSDFERPTPPSVRDEYFFLHIGVGEIQKRLDEKNAVFIGGGDCRGQVVIYVNGSPILIVSHGGVLTRIAEWIHGGQNEIVVEGEHAESIFLRVVTLSTPPRDVSAIFFDRLVAEVVMEADTNRQALTFDVGDLERENQSFERFPSIDSERREVEIEMRRVAARVAHAILAHDIQTVRELSSQGTEVEGQRWMRDEERAASERRRLLSFVQDRSLKLLDSDADLRVIWGERSALMYSGVDHDGTWGTPGAYAFRYESTMQKNGKILPLKFVRVRGEIILW